MRIRGLSCAVVVAIGLAGACSDAGAKSSCPRQGITTGGVAPAKRLKGAPYQGLTALLGVLRRPATTADRLPSFDQGPFHRDPLDGYGLVNYRYIRYAGQTSGGVHYYLVPGYVPAIRRLSRRCLAKLPRSERGYVKAEERRLSTRRGRALLTVVAITDDGTEVNGAGLSIAELKRGSGLDLRSSIFRPESSLAGVVPDGVAGVTVTARNTTRSVPVADNFFIAELPTAIAFNDAVTVVWQAADGTAIKTVHRP